MADLALGFGFQTDRFTLFLCDEGKPDNEKAPKGSTIVEWESADNLATGLKGVANTSGDSDKLTFLQPATRRGVSTTSPLLDVGDHGTNHFHVRAVGEAAASEWDPQKLEPDIATQEEPGEGGTALWIE